MATSDKFKIILLTIITFGLIWIWINKKQKTKEQLTVETKVKINIDKVIQLIGKDNINEITNTQQRVKITFKDRTNVQKEEIQSLKGISGTLFTSSSVILLVGKSANEVAKQLMLKK